MRKSIAGSRGANDPGVERRPEPRSYTLVVLREDHDELTTFDLPAVGSVCIGRSDENDVPVHDPSVSRKHARIHLSEELFVEDLGSANGTRLQSWERTKSEGPGATGKADLVDRRLSAGVLTRFSVGQVVQLGSVVIVVQRKMTVSDASDPVRRPRHPSPGAAAKPGAVVVDPLMQQLYEVAARVAASSLTVLLLGETGTGKEVLAETIHRRSRRADKPFVRLNCGAFAEPLLESELFGYERGAFTGAAQAKPGLLETAHEGTVFLDEIGELPPPLQVKLLRVVEDRMVLRVGATRARAIDVRFVAATHRNLEQEVLRGTFRQDLFFRINGACLFIPPLRERRSEILALARHFLQIAAVQADEPPGVLTDEVEAWLLAQAWPGNVRELRNAIERAAVMRGEGPILIEHLSGALYRPGTRPLGSLSAATPATLPEGSPRPTGAPPATMSTEQLRTLLDRAERDRIVRALDESGGNQSRAAKLLGISRGTLVARLRTYKLPRPRVR